MKMKIVFIVMTFLSSWQLLGQTQEVRVFAHRGGRMELDENTMVAFERSYEAGYRGFETDVRMTKDGELVIMHDNSLERTTNGKGEVEELTRADIEQLRTKQGNEILFLDESVTETLLNKLSNACKESYVTYLMSHSLLTFQEAEAIFTFQMNGCLAINRLMLRNHCTDWKTIQRTIDNFIRAGLEHYLLLSANHNNLDLQIGNLARKLLIHYNHQHILNNQNVYYILHESLHKRHYHQTL